MSTPPPGTFEVEATDGAARAGVLWTAHGPVRTPVFMPVGTKATVKALDPLELEALGAQIVLGNTYHLHLRPGEELIAELGGLHRFMAWDRPILTDSGGYQVFSLLDTARIDADGVTFRSVYDGTRGAPDAGARDGDPGGARLRHRDVLRRVPARRRAARRRGAGRRAHVGLGRALPGDASPRPASCASGSCRAAIDMELRRQSAEAIVALGFDGNAIGGLTVGEERSATFAVAAETAALLPAERPRYFMGIGDPEGLLRVFAAGVDMATACCRRGSVARGARSRGAAD